jgi:HrpA-like RNA helicase
MTKAAFQKSRTKSSFSKKPHQKQRSFSKKPHQKQRSFSKKPHQNSRENDFLDIKGARQLLEKAAPKEALGGIYDPNGIYNNPFTNEPYQNLYANEIRSIKGEMLPCTYANFAKIWTDLIVYKNKDELIEKITNNQIILAKAGTGVGKTVLIPRIAVHALNYKSKVICTVPKRLLARKNATFIAECMDVKLGEHVGYYYQGAHEINKNGVQTKLIFTTTGSIITITSVVRICVITDITIITTR